MAYTPPSIKDTGLRNHLGDRLYDEFVKLYNANISNAGIARYLYKNDYTDTKKSDRTIAGWREVHIYELNKSKETPG